MKLNAIGIVSADLFAILAVTFMVCLGTLAPLVHTEVLTYIDSKKTDKQSDPAAPDSHYTALVEILYVNNGKTQYVLHQPGSHALRFASYTFLLENLVTKTPEDLRVRVDRRVPSGIYQDLLLDANRLGIRVWQTNEGR